MAKERAARRVHLPPKYAHVCVCVWVYGNAAQAPENVCGKQKWQQICYKFLFA